MYGVVAVVVQRYRRMGRRWYVACARTTHYRWMIRIVCLEYDGEFPSRSLHTRKVASPNRCGNSLHYLATWSPPFWASLRGRGQIFTLVAIQNRARVDRKCGNFEGTTQHSPLHTIVWRNLYKCSKLRSITFLLLDQSTQDYKMLPPIACLCSFQLTLPTDGILFLSGVICAIAKFKSKFLSSKIFRGTIP